MAAGIPHKLQEFAVVHGVGISRRRKRGRLDSQGPSATPRLVDASSKAYDGFYGGGSSDDDDYRPRRRNPPRSPVTRQRRTLFQGDSAPETAWRA